MDTGRFPRYEAVSATVVALRVFNVIKKIPSGPVQRKIEEIGEEAVWEHFLAMRLYKIKGSHHRLPPKGVRIKFWRQSSTAPTSLFQNADSSKT